MRPAAGGGGSVFRGACIGLTWLWLAAFALVPAFALMLVSLLDKGNGDGGEDLPVWVSQV